MDGYDVPVSYGQADYWWLRSPDTTYGDDYPMLVFEDGTVGNGLIHVYDSHGRRPALRTPVMTTLRTT